MKQLIILLLSIVVNFALLSQNLSNDTLHWIEHRKLTWDDFKGEPLDLPTITSQAFMVMPSNFIKTHIFLPVSVSVETVFDRKNSWVIKNAKSEQSLKYYQVTFDLYEVYARKFRKECANTKFGLNPNKVFQEKYNHFLTALNDRDKLLMKETKMGLDSTALEKWVKTINSELLELNEYKSNKQ